MSQLPEVSFKVRVRNEADDYEWIDVTTSDLFSGKRVVLFSLPGAFTPTCSSYQLPGFEERYDEFAALGIDAIYCVSVNDTFVMNAWAQKLNINKVLLIPDGNAEFTANMGMLVSKRNLGFGNRSWRYAAVIDDGKIEWMVEEPGRCEDANDDPYEETTPDNLYQYVKSTVRETSQV
jgi:peroxiredoxin